MPPEDVDGPGGVLADERLHLSEGHLDGVHVGRIRRQIEELGALGDDGLFDAGDLMGGQIVHDDDVAVLEGGAQDLCHVGSKGWAIHGRIEHPGCCDTLKAQGGNESHGLPMAEGDLGLQALAPGRPTVETGHLGVDAGLVDENQALRIDEALRG